jgi:hypothetical protein
VDRAKAFYTDKIGFDADHDHRVTEVQDLPGGPFVFFSDPDGNGWSAQQGLQS